MGNYKVLQDIEAEDKLLGPLSLKQFIFAAITAVCMYLSFFAVTKHVTFLLVLFVPMAIISGFLAWPWSRDQSTEVWLLAKIRFFLKPRRRIWNQDGMQQLVTITAPKVIERHLTNDLSQIEVRSRLRALADTIDSRGWAIKNVSVNLSTSPSYVMQDPTSDRLVDVSALPREVPSIEVTDSDDIFENTTASHFDQMIGTSRKGRREQLMQRLKDVASPKTESKPEPTGSDMWFGQSGSLPPVPGAGKSQSSTQQDDQALLAQLHPDTNPRAAFGHTKVIDPAGSLPVVPPAPKANPMIQQLAANDDLNISTIARQAQQTRQEPPDDEVEVRLR